ncbi:hypothetical protein PsYK624_022360 [Phanerochaete sordida]|uniref:Secreted protein n=1 Tax=Phanerochaete sordida TaxID=48140 RepID=A0A9P3L8J6_9APHY|nr:hypothetical protein PsYK624_022360 [Phanerochaete sordida]
MRLVVARLLSWTLATRIVLLAQAGQVLLRFFRRVPCDRAIADLSSELEILEVHSAQNLLHWFKHREGTSGGIGRQADNL